MRLNRHGWRVLVSIASDDGAMCVDVFEDPAGGFGYQHFRADPEDQGRWTPIGGRAQPTYPSALAATTAAAMSIRWLRTHPQAAASLAAWQRAEG